MNLPRIIEIFLPKLGSLCFLWYGLGCCLLFPSFALSDRFMLDVFSGLDHESAVLPVVLEEKSPRILTAEFSNWFPWLSSTPDLFVSNSLIYLNNDISMNNYKS